MSNIDSIMLGHNQFFGVDHTSQDRARERANRFSDIQKILDIIDFSSSRGVNGLVLSTHLKTKYIMEVINSQPKLSSALNFYPLVPYAQGYVRKANEKGVIGLLNDVLEPAGTYTKLKILVKGGVSLLCKDILKILGTLIDIELLPFEKSNIKAIFLHNVFTDLGLSLKAENMFKFFIDYVNSNYDGAAPAFCTLNFPRLVNQLEEWGVNNPLIMTSFNKVGFQMNPSREECEKCLREHNVDVVAMSTLAAGYLKPKEAYDYLFSLPNIKSVVVGVSTVEHAKDTFRTIEEYRSLRKEAFFRG